MEAKYQKWAKGKDAYSENVIVDEPNNAQSSRKSENCVACRGDRGFWYDELCSLEKKFICETETEFPNDDPTFWRSCHQEGWDLIDRKCYLLLDIPVKYSAAEDYCLANGGKLIEPMYEMQDTMVRDFYFSDNKTVIYWLGINDRDDEGK